MSKAATHIKFAVGVYLLNQNSINGKISDKRFAITLKYATK